MTPAMTDTDQLIDDAKTAIRIHDGVLALKAERDRLREALAFYANPNNYKGLPPGYSFVPIDKDGGEFARSALETEG
jgi:hypothetical protein